MPRQTLLLLPPPLPGWIGKTLEEAGYHQTVVTSTSAFESALHERYDLILIDTELSGEKTSRICAQIRVDQPEAMIAQLVLPQAAGTLDATPATEVLVKPLSEPSLRVLLRNQASRCWWRTRVRHLYSPCREESEEFVFRSEALRKLVGDAYVLAARRVPTLICGPIGSGKKALARLMHRCSCGPDGPLAQVDCRQVAPSFLELRLFGATGASASTSGSALVQSAGGTLLINDIAQMPLETQRRLVEKLSSFERNHQLPAPRLIAVQSSDGAETDPLTGIAASLRELLGTNVLRLRPLKEHPEDVLLLAEYFLRQFSREIGRTIPEASVEAREALRAYAWPGNVRELRTWTEHAVYSGRLVVPGLPAPTAATDTPPSLRSAPARAPSTDGLALPPLLPDGPPLEVVEKLVIQRALRLAEGNRTQAARMLGISVRTLYTKLMNDAISEATVSRSA